MASKQSYSVLYTFLILSAMFGVVNPREEEDNSAWAWAKCLGLPLAAGVGTFFAAPVVAAGVLGAAGFTATGIAGGSMAASAMSAAAAANGGTVAAGSIVAGLQSVAATGIGIKATAAAAAGAAYVTKKVTESSPKSANGKNNED